MFDHHAAVVINKSSSLIVRASSNSKNDESLTRILQTISSLCWMDERLQVFQQNSIESALAIIVHDKKKLVTVWSFLRPLKTSPSKKYIASTSLECLFGVGRRLAWSFCCFLPRPRLGYWFVVVVIIPGRSFCSCR